MMESTNDIYCLFYCIAFYFILNICLPAQWTGLGHPLSLRLSMSPPSLCISVALFAPLGVRSRAVGMVHTSPTVYDSCQEG